MDDLGDEAEGDRLALLDDWAAQLEQCYSGTPTEPRLLALQHTIAAFDIETGKPLLDLIEANRMDQVTRRYETFEDVLEYCRHSANPVGLLYLTLIDHNDHERRALSNATCTALQLANSGRMCGATMPWDASTSRRRTCGGSATRRVSCLGVNARRRFVS